MRQPEARNPPRRPRLWRRLVRLPAARLRAARSRVHTQTHHTPSNSESSPGLFGRFCVFVHRGRAPRTRGPRRPGLAKLPRPGRVGPHVRGAIAIRLVVTRATRTAYVRGANGTKRERAAKQTER